MISSGFKFIGILAMVAGIAATTIFAADAGAVLPPAKRQSALDAGKKLLAARKVAPVSVDPFYSEAFAELLAGPSRPVIAGPALPAQRSAREILQSIGASLKPSGNFVMNGEHTLVFGQKRVKAGDFLTITFEGAEYVLEITAIERTRFTLRLNREEFTRPIK